MADTRRLGTVTIKVAGADLPAEMYDQITDVRVEQSVLVPDRFSVRFNDPSFDLIDADHFKIGQTLDISMDDGDGEKPVTKGEVMAIGVDQVPGGRHELVVSGLDRAHRMAVGTKVRTFLNQTDADIIRQIAGEYGLSLDCDASSIQHQYLLQNQTDYAFVSERAWAIGYVWWVDDQKLCFKKDRDHGKGPKLTFGEELRSFKVRCSASEVAPRVTVRSWDPATQRAIVGEADMGAAGANGVDLSTTAPLATEQLSAARSVKTVPRFTGEFGLDDAGEANAFAQSLAQRATAEQVTAKGEVIGDPSLKAGTRVDIAGVGTKLAGSYVLTSVEHVIGTDRQYVTRFTSGGRRPSTLVDLLGGEGAGRPQDPGLLVGVVTNGNDPFKQGRVKVKLPSLSDDDESWWARPASVGAGTQRGVQVGFEQGDEVIVGFEQGDFRRPVVLGGLWSQVNQPPRASSETLDADGKIIAHVWRTRAGHVIELHQEDSPAKSFVSITLKDKATRLLLSEQEVVLESPAPIQVNSKQTITVQALGNLTLEGANVKITAKGQLAMEAAAVSVKAQGPVQLEGLVAEMKASTVATVQGSTMAAVRGGIVKLN